jgi:hypothetical protein
VPAGPDDMRDGTTSGWAASAWLMPLVLVLSFGAVTGPNMTPRPIGVGLLMTLVGLVSLGLGWLTGRIFRIALPWEQSLLLGFLGFLYAVTVPTFYFGVHQIWPLSALAVALTAAILWIRPDRRPALQPDPPSMFLCLAAAFAFTAFWTLETSARFTDFAGTGVLRLWSDTLLHAVTINGLGDIRTIGRLGGALADMPLPFYHFVSFGLPALPARLLDVPALPLVTGAWQPLGIWCMALGLLALARTLGGIPAAALAMLLLAALPDGTSFGLQQGFLSFHWLNDTSPGAPYALGFALLSLALLRAQPGAADLRVLILAGGVMCCVLLVRANIFLWLAFPWAVGAIVTARFLPRRLAPWLIGLVALVGIAGLLVLSRGEIARDGWLTFLDRYVELLRIQQIDTPFAWIANPLHQDLGRAAALPALLLLTVAAPAPLLLAAAVGLWILAWRRGALERFDAVLPATLFWGCVLILLGPTPPHGDYTEWRQRGFPLVNLLLIAWVALLAVRLFPRLAAPRILALLACAATLVTWQQAAAWKAPRLGWAIQARELEIPGPIRAASAWLRAAARPDEAFTLSEVETTDILIDRAVEIAALSGVPAYLSRKTIFRRIGGPQAMVVEARDAQLRRLLTSPRDVAMEELHRAGVAFYVVLGGEGPAWAQGGEGAAFRSDGVVIFRTDGR